MNSNSPLIKTERLELWNMSTLEAPFMFKLLNEPSYIQNIANRNADSIEATIKIIETRLLPSYKEHGFGIYVVKLKDGTPIGINGLIKRDFLNDVDIGYAFLPAFWGKGYAIESAIGVRDYARDVLKFKRLIGITLPDNEPSAKVLEKIGMKFEKMITFADDGKETRLFGMSF